MAGSIHSDGKRLHVNLYFRVAKAIQNRSSDQLQRIGPSNGHSEPVTVTSFSGCLSSRPDTKASVKPLRKRNGTIHHLTQCAHRSPIPKITP